MSSPWTLQCAVVGNEIIEAAEVAGIASMHLFDAGALAVGEDHDTGGEASVQLIAGFGSKEDAEGAAELLGRRMPDLCCRVIADESHQTWVQSQQASLHPTTIGAWRIRAPWHDEDNGEASSLTEIIIDPGAAFGHGAHPSTRLAIELLLATLQRTNVDAEAVVDLGTGTGVIAIIAAKLGFPVRASDNDPAAIEVATRNIDANGVGRLIELTSGDASDTAVRATDFVVANVTIDVHRVLAPSYQTANTIVVSGLLCGQVAEMCELLDDHRPATVRTAGEWAAIVFDRALLER